MRLNRNLPGSRMLLVALVAVCAVVHGSRTFAQNDDGAHDDQVLKIGAKAPTLDIETWFSDREGEFEQTTEFEPGKVYLIDFWATWSTASHPWMVKYADLQDRYFDDGLQIIRISDEDEDSVANFLELDVRGNPETIYAEWSIGYCVTTDPDRSVYEDYVVAAQQSSIPVVFIVGRTGLVEWVGNPAKMKKPLKQILADKWDRATFGAKLLAEQRMNKMATEVQGLLRRGETEEALKLIEKMMVDAPDSKVKAEMAMLRLSILLQTDGPNIAEAFQQVAESLGDDFYKLNEIAWSIVTREQGGKEISPELLEVATETAERGVELARKSGNDDLLGMILDTHAHLVFLQGDLDRAIEIQIEAGEKNQRDDIFEYLDELQKMKSERESKEANSAQTSEDNPSDGKPAEAPPSEESEPKTESPDPAGIKT